MKQLKYISFILVLLVLLLLTSPCKKGPYVAVEGDIVQVTAAAYTVTPGGKVLLTITGMKANGHPMPDDTLVRLSADIGSFQNMVGGKVEAVLLVSGKATVYYKADGTLTGGTATITASCGTAKVTPEKIVISISNIDVTSILMSANPSVLPPGGSTTVITATAVGVTGAPMPGKTITLNTTAGELTPPGPLVTDSNGNITATLTTTAEATVTASYQTVTKSITITVGENQPPVAAFAFSPQNPFSGQTIHFTSTSTDPENTPMTYHWNFGDGKSGTGEAVDHSYTVAAATEFKVILTVTDSDNAQSIAEAAVPVAVHKPPEPSFSFTPEKPLAGDTVQFISEVKQGDGDITDNSYKWDFGDGTVVRHRAHPSHKFEDSAVFNVTLTVTDSYGITAAISKPVPVGNIDNTPPTAGFVFSPANPYSGDTIYFNASDSTDPDGTIENYHWNFGDGQTVSSKDETNPTHSYTVNNQTTFVVTLTVTDDKGDTGVISKEVEVSITPQAHFVFTPPSPKTKQPVTFDASSSKGNIIMYEWDFGDGGTKQTTEKTTQHEFQHAGNFKVLLTVTDTQGNKSAVTSIITISD